MAVDEALLVHGHAPVLRLYGWSEPSISLGATQPKRQDLASLLELGLPVVRRLTGGGAILHADELTYSVTLDLDHPVLDGADREESYHRLHVPIVQALADHGLEVSRGQAALESLPRAEEPILCFGRSTVLDLLADGSKLVGSAQRRRGGRLLQHGSIILTSDPRQPGTASLATSLETPPSADMLAASIARQFGVLFGPLDAGDLLDVESEHAARRAASFRYP